jgi:hypothetical protein
MAPRLGKSQLPRFALATVLLVVIGAQMPGQQKTDNLEFRLQPEAVEGGVPQAFSFLLVNTIGHDIRVPMPTDECEDSFSSAIWLRLYFKPLKPEPRWVRGDGSYLAASDPRVHFGLGKSTEVDRIQVRWLAGGCNSWNQIAVDQIVTLR